MKVLDRLEALWRGIDYPFFIHSAGELRFSEIAEKESIDLSAVASGDVVALIGDFDPRSILTLLQLIDKKVILGISKSDLLDDELTKEIRAIFPKELEVVFFSAVSQQNITKLKDTLWNALQ